jgi:hypothetical protein
MRAILLHNPGAGSGDIAPEDLLAALACGGISARYCSAKSPDFPAALREPADLVVIAGGDGTVVKAIDHLRDRNIPIAILPLGSAVDHPKVGAPELLEKPGAKPRKIAFPYAGAVKGTGVVRGRGAPSAHPRIADAQCPGIW